ncbi:KdsC family phosphatase [Candidatus Kryptobacter tengchongensis]|uniref:3-deoxy-D-manno-octulosonate 8-phosphate phosphatase (KDO 8-P phosphatase) n=1 Tax=Kryptobacter tengchongensis TaxID=1643429 RepID=A0A916LJZ7_KRYT1|nr:HAD family hydrolase [Candidatus Kryptobacter tengchongensis]CUT00609.1 3-deoxy-D-manno-octulosonate 8-phosphate phosphatase (KDO 8-P phosphatase) [Candidatus Kryptobacter tengchongensis]
MKIRKDAIEKAKKVKMILLDVDGVLTDGSIIYSSNCGEIKIFNAQDGFGIVRAIELGLKVGIITGRESDIIKKRANELGITDLIQNAIDKVKPFEMLASKYDLRPEQFCYIGDDILDIPLLKIVGFSAADSNARNKVKTIVD